MSALDLDHLRNDTPGVNHRIHLNNAGSALMPQPVLRTVQEHLELESRIGGYEAADDSQDRIRGVYEEIAGLLGGRADNVAVMENATAAFNAALSAVPFQSGDVLLTSRNDYVSNQIAFLSLQERFGIRVVRAPDAPEGGVDVQAFDELAHRLRPRVATVTHVPTSSGLVQPVAEIARRCRARDIPLIVDACQSVGQMPVDVGELDADFVSATARKFLRGPRGIGFLYVSDRVLERGWQPLFPDLQGADWIEEDLYQPAPDARRFENWEFPFALVLGMGEAVRYARALGMDVIRERTWGLARDLRSALAAVPGVRVLDQGPELSGIVTISVDGWTPPALKAAFGARGINTSSSMRAYAVLDYDDKGVAGSLRLSPHYYNTHAEIVATADALLEIVGQ